MNRIFENTSDASLFDLFLREVNMGDKINLNIMKSKLVHHKSALKYFEHVFTVKEHENMLFIDFKADGNDPKFLDKFYMIEIQESRGIVLHDKVNFEILEEAGQRRLCIVPKDLNDRGVVCTIGSKFSVINNRQFEKIPTHDSTTNDEYVSYEIAKGISKFNAFKINQNKLCQIKEPCKLLAILEISSKWNYVSSIRNLPSHIYGSMEHVNQIKNKYFHNSKEENIYFCDKYKTFAGNEHYNKF
jgi:predicted nuclease of predicted toxin-antitoxin system